MRYGDVVFVHRLDSANLGMVYQTLTPGADTVTVLIHNALSPVVVKVRDITEVGKLGDVMTWMSKGFSLALAQWNKDNDMCFEKERPPGTEGGAGTGDSGGTPPITGPQTPAPPRPPAPSTKPKRVKVGVL